MVEKAERLNRSPYSELKVGNATAITFLRCLPGLESKVGAKLCTIPDAVVYKVFGESDFAIVREFPDQPKPLPVRESNDICRMRTMICFSWEGLNALPVTDIRDYPLVGFCFLKANPDFISNEGIRGEHDLLTAIKEFIRRRRTNIRATVCGTVGWFEAVLLVYGTSLSDILRFTNELRRLGLRWPDNKATHSRPCFQTTETIPAIIIDQGMVRPGVQLGSGVKLELSASCYSWADSRVKKHLNSLGKPYSIAGTDDWVVHNVKVESLSEYVQALWGVRARTKDLLYATHTSFILTRSSGGGEEDLEVRALPKINANLQDPKLQQLSMDNPTLHQMLSDTYLLLNDMLLDCRKNWAVTDLIPFAKELLNSYIASEHGPNANRALGHGLEMLRWGIQQRFLGTEAMPVGVPPVPSNAGGTGGIHRILTALSLIPEVITESVGMKWTGFMTCGWTDEFKRFLCGVLNIPSQAIFQPNSWFTIFHEVGHEHASQIDITGNTNIRRALIKEGMYTKESREEVSEVYAEIFAYLFGFGGNFDKCIDQTWKYLVSLDKIQTGLSQFFLRFLMVYIFMLEDSGSEYINCDEKLLSIARKLKKNLGKYASLIADFEESEIKSVCSKVLKLRTVLDVIRDLMPTNRMTWSPEEIDYTPLSEGRILFMIDNPVQFLSSISSVCPSPTFRQSVAITLSMWNAKMLRNNGRD